MPRSAVGALTKPGHEVLFGAILASPMRPMLQLRHTRVQRMRYSLVAIWTSAMFDGIHRSSTRVSQSYICLTM
jgi:hypothetical protein